MTEFVEGQQPGADDAQIGAEETVGAPVEGGEPQQAAADPFEDVAREHGWTPKEEWRGKPDDWRGPREFVAYGMKRSRESADEMKSMRSELKSIGRVAEVIQRRAVEDARRDVEQRFADAVESKDHEGARAAREELSRIDREASAPAQDEVQAFVSRNSWFNQNRAATLIAQGVTAQLAQQGVSVSEQLRQAEEAVRAEMPHLFGQGQAPAKQPASVSAPQTRAAQPSARAKGFADLPANAQAAGRDFVKRGMVKNLEDYAKVYLEENA